MPSPSLSTADTPSASCVNDTSSVAKRSSAPSSRALSARIGSARSWLAFAHPAGDRALKSGPSPTSMSLNTRPVTLSATVMRKPGSGGPASTMRLSTPATRSASIVCGN